MASFSLVPSSLPRNRKHHVFLSFHGIDVRRSFLSHVLKELKSKAIDLFIDNDIERSKSIGPELIEAIRGSRIAIVVLSKNYASSTWCLDELVEIIKCREELGQTVMVLFYEVDPTDVKKQTGDFGKVFRETCKGKTKDNVERWKQALVEVAKIAGYHSKNWDDEAKMIENIAKVVSNKLNFSTPSSDFDGLVGLESHMINMGPLLRPDLEEVRIIGILGPSGIGKTTIARFLFNRYSQYFHLSVFMENIRASYPMPVSSDDYSIKKYFQEQFLSQLLNEESFKIPHLGIVKDRLNDKKVLVVLDDVDRLVQLEAIAKEKFWFGPSSRIIITTQDERLLKASGVNHIYRVEFPSNSEAFQIFCMYAFGQNSPKNGFSELAWVVTELAGNLPLGLRIMGSYFRGMSKQEWIRALPRVLTTLKGEITSILKFGYDALCDEDQNLFLHIACFFNNEPVAMVEYCLAKSFSDVTQGLQVLAEKSLISMDLDLDDTVEQKSEDYITMHNLLVQLGREIVRKQSVSVPAKRQFLVDARDIAEVLGDDKAGTSTVIGIDFGLSNDDKEDITCISEIAFERLSNLQFLRILGVGTNLFFPQSLKSISQKLRSLSWERFPMPCLPSNFSPQCLVKLEMPNSQLEKLWDGIQPLSNLKWMYLCGSENLKELPDLSTAINLWVLDVRCCSNLVMIPSIGNDIKLRILGLEHCSSLVEFPSFSGNAPNLEYLDLSHCSSMVFFSSIGNPMNLRSLSLKYCSSLVELPSFLGNAINLEEMNLSYCSGLVELPSSLGNVVTLKILDLGYCSSLVELPFSIGNLIKLKELDLRYCSSLVKLPFSMGNLIKLEELDLSHCSSLVELPSMKNLCRLWNLNLEKCSKLEVVLTNINLESLKYIDLRDCSLLKGCPETSINTDDQELSGKQELIPYIGRISVLGGLNIMGMQKLVSLPQLPDSLLFLNAENCEFLERIDCFFRNPNICLNFANCFRLNQEARDLIIQRRTNRFAVLPGREVPGCFTYRASGVSLTVKLNRKPLGTSTKFRVCLLVAEKAKHDYVYFKDIEVYCNITSKENPRTSASWGSCNIYLKPVFAEHLYTFEVKAKKVTSTELAFDFEFPVYRHDDKYWEIKECGVIQLMEDPPCDEHYDGEEDSDTEDYDDDEDSDIEI